MVKEEEEEEEEEATEEEIAADLTSDRSKYEYKKYLNEECVC